MGNECCGSNVANRNKADISKLIDEMDTFLNTPRRDKDALYFRVNLKKYLKLIEDIYPKVRQFLKEEHHEFHKMSNDFGIMKDAATNMAQHNTCGVAEESRAYISEARQRAKQLNAKFNELHRQIIEKFPDAAESIDKKLAEIEAKRAAREAEVDRNDVDDED